MARRATIVDKIEDVWGDEWDVREYRATPHGFPIAFGWPRGIPRGAGGAGGPRVIVTPELARHFEAHRLAPINLALPLGSNAIKRVRRLLGHHRQIDGAAWWEERVSDLSDLTLEQFADRHSVSMTACLNARHGLFGRKLRPAGWWRQEDVARILISPMSRSEIADTLDISVGSVGRLRYMLRTAQIIDCSASARQESNRYRPLDEAATAQAKLMLEQGMAANQVAVVLGVSDQRIYKAIGDGRLPPTKERKRKRTAAMLQAIELVKGGMSRGEAAELMGVNRVGLATACRQSGIFARKRRRDVSG